MLPSLDHFGREVVESATQGVAPGGGGVDGPAKVGNLDLALGADEEILGLDVAVDDVLLVAVGQGLAEVGDVPGRSALGEAAAVGQLLVQLPAGTVLEDEVDALGIVEVAKHAEDIAVAQVRLDLDLTTELVLDAGLEQLGLLQDLERNDVFGTFFASQVDGTELAAAEGLADLKVVEGPLTSCAGAFGLCIQGLEAVVEEEEVPAEDSAASNGTRCAPPPEANVRFRPALAGPLVRPPFAALLSPTVEAEAEALPPAFSLFNAVGSYIVVGYLAFMTRQCPKVVAKMPRNRRWMIVGIL